MSVHQTIAYQTLVTTYKIVKSGKPTYIAQKMKTRVTSMKLRGRLGSIHQASHSLSITKEGFVYRGANLFNRIDENLRNEDKISKFKSGAKAWVLKNIQVKPSSRYPNLIAKKTIHRPGPPPPPLAPPQSSQKSIRGYLVPRNVPVHTNSSLEVKPHPRRVTASHPTPPAKPRPPSTPRLPKPVEKATITCFFKPKQQQLSRHSEPQSHTPVALYKTQVLPPDT